MTVAQRIRHLRLMERMKKSNNCVRTEDGTLQYVLNGEVLIEAKMVEAK